MSCVYVTIDRYSDRLLQLINSQPFIHRAWRLCGNFEICSLFFK